jgi:hypothetical protein
VAKSESVPRFTKKEVEEIVAMDGSRSLVKEMARAIYEDRHRPTDFPEMAWKHRCEATHLTYEGHALAALAIVLKAMREPSEAVCEAANAVSRLDPGEALEIWRAMRVQWEKEQGI